MKKVKRSLEEQKLSLLSKCSDILSSTETSNKKPISLFALYVDEKLSRFDNKKKTLVEKKP